MAHKKLNKANQSDVQSLAMLVFSRRCLRRYVIKGEAMNFTAEQKSLVYDSAVCLKRALVECKDPLANELLDGELGEILISVIDGDAKYPITCIPHFDQMTRDWLPEIEDEYFNFYSFARYGKSAFE